MPVVCIPLEETQRTVLFSSLYSVVQDVMRQINIPYGTLIAMHKGLEINRTDNRVTSDIHPTSNLPSTVSQRRVIVNITEDYNEDALSTTAVSYADASPIFLDRSIDAKVFPVYVSSDITLELKLTTPSKTEAVKLRDELRIKLSQMRNIEHHSVDYDILIPALVEEFIADIHQLKSRLHPSELGEYFRANCTKRMHLLTDTARVDNAQLAIRERLVRIVGTFDFNPMPDVIDENNDQNTYTLTIPYKFTMEVPRGMCIDYPTTVCNRPMPSKYLKWIEDEKIRTKEEYSRNLTYSASMSALSHFEAHRQLDYRINNKRPINLPLWDQFAVRQGHAGYMTVATFLTAVDETDRKTLFNLRDIPHYHMDDTFLKCLQEKEWEYITHPYESLFYLGLYYPERYFDADILSLSKDLLVSSAHQLPLEKTTRVGFSVCVDPSFLSKTAYERWLKYRWLILNYLGEVITVVRDYKQEMGDMLDRGTGLYPFIARTLQPAINDQDHDYLKDLIRTLQEDPFILQQFLDHLNNKHPSVYQTLDRVVDLKSHRPHDMGPWDRTGEDFRPKTVMAAYTTVYRK